HGEEQRGALEVLQLHAAGPHTALEQYQSPRALLGGEYRLAKVVRLPVGHVFLELLEFIGTLATVLVSATVRTLTAVALLCGLVAPADAGQGCHVRHSVDDLLGGGRLELADTLTERLKVLLGVFRLTGAVAQAVSRKNELRWNNELGRVTQIRELHAET